MSRLIERLDALIAGEEAALPREILKARRTAALARNGHFPEARFALAGLRSQSHRHRDPALSAWVALVDGMIDHCETLAPSAREKFRRAHQLAATADAPTLHAECAAWLAAADLNANDAPALAANAAQAWRLAPADAHAARARAALVLADAWRHAGDDDRAQPWYKAARQHAVAEGDAALVSFLLHNLAAFRVGRISLQDAFEQADRAEAQRVLLEVDSTGNYDAGVGVAQLMAQVPLLRAQLLVALNVDAEAVDLIDAHLPRARVEGQAHREARYLADAAFAEARLGRLEEAGRRLRLIQAVLPLMEEADDLAATHARLARACEKLGRDEAAAGHWAAAREALGRHEEEQRAWAQALAAATPA